MDKFDSACQFLKRTSARGIVPGLSRIKELLRRLGAPQERVRIIHVSGTNGKGSFSAMLTSVLSSAGYRTGSFSSPAITGVTDSFRINGSEISRDIFAEVVLRIADIWETMEDKPTEFEVLTAAAYEIFFRQGCDLAVVECGLGGDEDSTNVITSPLLSVITNVQLDHCAILGDTPGEIASHKAGIIKPGRPVYFGGGPGEALEVIRSAAEKMSAELHTPSPEEFRLISDSDLSGTRFSWRGDEYTLALLGSYQYLNAINVLSCIDILRSEGLSIPDDAVRSGLEQVRWHGRFEVLRRDPIVICDGAHNPDGIREAARSIRQYFGTNKVALLIGVMADKDYRLYPQLLGESLDRVFAVTPDNPRSLDSNDLAAVFSGYGIPAQGFPELDQGVRCAYEYAQSRGLPLIALGSLYMYRQFTAALDRISPI